MLQKIIYNIVLGKNFQEHMIENKSSRQYLQQSNLATYPGELSIDVKAEVYFTVSFLD